VTDTNRILNTKHNFVYLPLVFGVTGFSNVTVRVTTSLTNMRLHISCFRRTSTGSYVSLSWVWYS